MADGVAGDGFGTDAAARATGEEGGGMGDGGIGPAPDAEDMTGGIGGSVGDTGGVRCGTAPDGGVPADGGVAGATGRFAGGSSNIDVHDMRDSS
jgi:hypothetical protein